MTELDLNHENLPAPMGFALNVDDVELWDYLPDPEEHDGEVPRLNKVFGTPTLDVVLVEMPPGTKLPWHVHEPHTAQIYWLLEGRARTNYKDRDGEVHSYESDAADEQLVYLPAGAHNELESVGDETLRLLSFKEGGGTVNGRLEHLVGDPSGHYDPKGDRPGPGLDIVPTRGHVFDKQNDAVEEY